MFNLYNRDIGLKYKNKYRSLLFNIKDEKNNGLFRKIINGIIKPKDLVCRIGFISSGKFQCVMHVKSFAQF
jgi:hypothetical protein